MLVETELVAELTLLDEAAELTLDATEEDATEDEATELTLDATELLLAATLEALLVDAADELELPVVPLAAPVLPPPPPPQADSKATTASAVRLSRTSIFLLHLLKAANGSAIPREV